MSVYQYRLGGAPKGFQRVLRYDTVGQWACPHYTAEREAQQYSDHHEMARTGTTRTERVDSSEAVVQQPQGVELITRTQVVRRYRVAKGGPVPVCKCGAAMVWLGWPVWLYDEAEGMTSTHGGFAIRNATADKLRWKRYGKTRKAQAQLIDNALTKGGR